MFTDSKMDSKPLAYLANQLKNEEIDYRKFCDEFEDKWIEEHAEKEEEKEKLQNAKIDDFLTEFWKKKNIYLAN